MHPITYGDYPKSMRDIVGNRLPKFTPDESKSLAGSFDFLGLNYYTANYANDVAPATANFSFYVDVQANFTSMLNFTISVTFLFLQFWNCLYMHTSNHRCIFPIIVTQSISCFSVEKWGLTWFTGSTSNFASFFFSLFLLFLLVCDLQ